VENQLRVLYAFAVAWLGGHTRGVIMSGQETFQPGRRDLGKLGLGSVMGAPVATSKAKAAVHPNGPGIKLCAQSGFAPTDERLLFLKQIGAQHAGSDAQSAGARPEDRQGQPVWHPIYAVASMGRRAKDATGLELGTEYMTDRVRWCTLQLADNLGKWATSVVFVTAARTKE